MTPSLSASTKHFSPKTDAIFAPNGSEKKGVQTVMTIGTSAQAAEPPPMELSTALEHRRQQARTPYKPDAWELALRAAGIIHRFRKIPDGLKHGFILSFPNVTRTQSPPNKDSIITYFDEFNEIVHKELIKGRYIGPFPFSIIEASLGTFQSSPLSIVPKPGRPGKFRLVQNFSFPSSPSRTFPNPSINSYINSDEFPSTWGKFSVILLLISHLPAGSEAATRDVAEAYRTIPLHPSQWPATVVRVSHTHGCIDTCAAFGATPSSGGYGHVADAGAEIMRFQGIGPLDKWVDDHIFFRIQLPHLEAYNAIRARLHQVITKTGIRQTGGRIWFGGRTLDDGSVEEFSEDCSFPIKDLSRSSPRSDHDKLFTYNLSDIDAISAELGIPWEISKDQPFHSSTTYIGLLWDLDSRTVTLSPSKLNKYLLAIHTWRKHPIHCLQDVQELYGKLLHTCSVVPRGRAYLTGLESMLSTCSKDPFKPHRPDKCIAADLDWWTNVLQSGLAVRHITPPPALLNPRAFSDASSGFGIAITIGNRWRAWRLIPGWQTLQGKRDIAWAEAIGFELLIRTLAILFNTRTHVIVHGDNTSVVEGWWNGRSRNPEVNCVFKRLHSFIHKSDTIDSVVTTYIASQHNPADKPSRGVFDHTDLLLPPVHIPQSLSLFIIDANLPLTPQELRLHAEGRYAPSATNTIDRLRRQQEAVDRARALTQHEDTIIRTTLHHG
jgi:hypothetical protein